MFVLIMYCLFFFLKVSSLCFYPFSFMHLLFYCCSSACLFSFVFFLYFFFLFPPVFHLVTHLYTSFIYFPIICGSRVTVPHLLHHSAPSPTTSRVNVARHLMCLISTFLLSAVTPLLLFTFFAVPFWSSTGVASRIH